MTAAVVVPFVYENRGHRRNRGERDVGCSPWSPCSAYSCEQEVAIRVGSCKALPFAWFVSVAPPADSLKSCPV
jgi:hypothetical protein